MHSLCVLWSLWILLSYRSFCEICVFTRSEAPQLCSQWLW